ncbi:MAG: response regulator [candidate division WOR-3 bacterium]|nr:response regulator [candidate division WOR-3 bacterium]MCX7836745.1 response regulator [candidate division WOR-3 bacterium]MDW8113938.1 response regulator [candidate division WOR-3 bacterium]
MIKILLIDDNFDLGNTIKELLELKGYEVEYVEDGFWALDRLKEDNFDLVIMDIVMPGMDGIETFKKMREIKKDIKVIFLSAFVDEKRREELNKMGIKDFLEKPCDFQKLLNKIENLFDYKKEKEA